MVSSEYQRKKASIRDAEETHDNGFSSSPFRFLDLPLEIRNQIYYLCLVKQRTIVQGRYMPAIGHPLWRLLHKDEEGPKFRHIPLNKNLLSVSARVHDEASIVLYRSTSFMFIDHWSYRAAWKDLVLFVEGLTDVSRKSLRAVSIASSEGPHDCRGLSVLLGAYNSQKDGMDSSPRHYPFEMSYHNGTIEDIRSGGKILTRSLRALVHTVSVHCPWQSSLDADRLL